MISNGPLIAKLYDVYWAITHGYSVSADTVLSSDGRGAAESIGQLLRDYGHLTRAQVVPAVLKRKK